METEDRKIPFKEGMWIMGSDGEPRLLGSRCPSCGELFFPKKENDICAHCQHEGLEDTSLSPRGKIVSFTTVMQSPAGGHYHGPVPFSFGLVDLDDGVRVETQLGGDFEKLRVGMDVELAIENLYKDQEGNEIQIFRFRPIEQ